MKLAFDAKRLFNNFTGLGNYSRFVVRALQETFPAHEYMLFTPQLKPTSEAAFFAKPPFRVHTCRWPGLKSYWRSVELGRIAHRMGAEIFHGLSNELPVRQAPGLPLVCTVHDLIFMRCPELYPRFDRTMYRAKLQHVCNRADRIIAISEQTARDLQELFSVDAARVRVVYQGCSPAFYQPVSQEARVAVRWKYQLPSRFVLMVGTLEERKNAALVLRALAAMKEKVPVVFVGRQTGYQRVLDTLIRAHHLEKWVRFAKVDYVDLPTVYQLAAAFVYPSRYEGFGIPIVEAIAAGVPVITTRGGVFAEAGGPDSWYVDPDQPEELAATLAAVLEAPAHHALRLVRSREYISRFSASAAAHGLMRVYKEVRLAGG